MLGEGRVPHDDRLAPLRQEGAIAGRIVQLRRPFDGSGARVDRGGQGAVENDEGLVVGRDLEERDIEELRRSAPELLRGRGEIDRRERAVGVERIGHVTSAGERDAGELVRELDRRLTRDVEDHRHGVPLHHRVFPARRDLHHAGEQLLSHLPTMRTVIRVRPALLHDRGRQAGRQSTHHQPESKHAFHDKKSPVTLTGVL